MKDGEVRRFLEKYAEENDWHLGGWHPDGEMIVGHFHRTNSMYQLTTEFLAFDRQGNLLKAREQE